MSTFPSVTKSVMRRILSKCHVTSGSNPLRQDRIRIRPVHGVLDTNNRQGAPAGPGHRTAVAALRGALCLSDGYRDEAGVRAGVGERVSLLYKENHAGKL